MTLVIENILTSPVPLILNLMWSQRLGLTGITMLSVLLMVKLPAESHVPLESYSISIEAVPVKRSLML